MSNRVNIIGSRIRNLRNQRRIQQGELAQAITMN